MKKDRSVYAGVLAAILLVFVLAMAASVRAELPVPEVKYFQDVPALRLTFAPEGYFPPAGAASWLVDVEKNGFGVTYQVAPVDREVWIRLAETLLPGQYLMRARIIDVEGNELEASPLFDWTLNPDEYQAEVPRVAIDESWDTAIALTCHGADVPVAVTISLYGEGGEIAVDGATVEIPIHGSKVFYFSTLFKPGVTFYGSALLAAEEPVRFQVMQILRGSAPVIVSTPGRFELSE